ncbi:PAS domain-containing protein [Methylobacterium planeticum]|uniref:Blue-light-activated histidine kinase n=1 Tax=Methylobacterium planeticum TaxID=2615211 RepID=A0A6N6MTH0_9HYPH|nr:PAS domain-containing protein [Methylobacterium planeticum]KAB1074269.1 PAS domain-containing protein [Methylobacterium planeticum]
MTEPTASAETDATGERVSVLASYGILDTAPEVGFDDVVLVASELCAAPVALVSFVAADRQWFKARVGFAAAETGLACSICAHALAAPGLLVIADLTADPRTRDNPLVTGPEGLRFYAGVRLDTPDGVGLGTLCVLDVAPRPEGLPPGQAAGLAALARQIMALMELRRTVFRRDADIVQRQEAQEVRDASAVRLGETALLMRLAIEATDLGVFDYDLVADRLEWDGRTRALFGAGPDEPVSFADSFLPRLHPEDRARVLAEIEACVDPQGAGSFASEFRIQSPDGARRWLSARGRRVVAGGRAARLVCTLRDLTGRKESDLALRAIQDRYRLVTRATNDAIWDWDLSTGTMVWNEALQAAYGWRPEQVEPTGAWWIARVHPDDRAQVDDDIRRVVEGRASEWRHEYRFARADGSFAEVLDRGYMVRDGAGTPLRMIGALLDVTERNQAGAQFRAVFEGANLGIVQLDPRSLKALRVNAKLCEIWGAPAEDILGQSVAKWTPEEDAEARDALHRRLANGEIMQETLEKRYRRADGRLIWGRVNLVSQVLGDAIQTTAMIEDITQERLAEERQRALIELGDALRDAPDRGAMLSAAGAILGRTLRATRAGYRSVDAAAGLFTPEGIWPPSAAEGPAVPRPLSDFPATARWLRRGETLALPDITADPRFAADAAGYADLRVRALIEVPLIQRGKLVGILFAHASEWRAWPPGEVAFAREVAERAWDALGRFQAEDQQRLLNRELSHRLKNTLAMVQAIASQTLRNAPDFETAKESLAARLIALGKAHDILLTGERESADINAVITGALSIHDDRQPGRFAIGGPTIEIGPKAALSLSLMMHELATNAVKYGALSVPEGRVVVDWQIAGGGGEPTLRMAWTEHGGPAVLPPARRGFGSRLIERGLAGAIGGAVALLYEPGGVVCRVEAPLAGFQAAD